MQLKYFATFTIAGIFFWSCMAANKSFNKNKQIEDWGQFNLKYANDFVSKITALPAVQSISIIDTKADGNDFKVNGQDIFIDTNLIDHPNYYSYQKRAKELNVNKDSLLSTLHIFYKVGAKEFNCDNKYYRFKVISYWATEKGYLFTKNERFKLGDTISATSVKNRDFIYKVVLTKQIDQSWFEYYSIK